MHISFSMTTWPTINIHYINSIMFKILLKWFFPILSVFLGAWISLSTNYKPHAAPEVSALIQQRPMTLCINFFLLIKNFSCNIFWSACSYSSQILPTSLPTQLCVLSSSPSPCSLLLPPLSNKNNKTQKPQNHINLCSILAWVNITNTAFSRKAPKQWLVEKRQEKKETNKSAKILC